MACPKHGTKKHGDRL